MPPDSTNLIQIFFDTRQWNPATIAAFLGVVATLISPLITVAVKEWLRWRKQRLLERDFDGLLYDTETIKRATRYYIPPDCSSVDPAQEAEIRRILPTQEKLFQKIDNYLSKDESGRHLLLLADSGMGKSSFVLNYYARNQRRSRRKRHRLAVVPLGIANADEKIAKIEKQHETVIFLDAFDEDTKAIRNHRDRLFELMQLCQNFKRVLITCRSQFFPKDEEIPTATGISRVGPRGSDGRYYDFWKLYLSPLSDEQVEQFVCKRYLIWQPVKRKKARQAITKIPMLSVRPMLLAFIPDLLETGTGITTSFQLYELLVEKWLQREKGWAEPDDLRAFSEHLAVDLYVNRIARQSERIPGPELEPLAKQWRIKLNDWQLRGRSLLNRDAEGNYKFAHRSILEYLVVRTLVASSPVGMVNALTDQMEKFLYEKISLAKDYEILVANIAKGKNSALLFSHTWLMKALDPPRRAQAGSSLTLAGDPRLEVTTLDHVRFCFVPAGPFWMGSPNDDKNANNNEKPLHLNRHLLYNYWVTRFPITVAQFHLFLKHSVKGPLEPEFLQEPANHPVRYVTWYEAMEFCEWLTRLWWKQGKLIPTLRVTLPSEAEWEKAARGGLEILEEPVIRDLQEAQFALRPNTKLINNALLQRQYPWGDNVDPNYANYTEARINAPSSVGCFPDGVSPYGCEDMVGNVWEWTRTLYKPYPYTSKDVAISEASLAERYAMKPFRMEPEASREPCVLRGGSFHVDSGGIRCSSRIRYYTHLESRYLGFRLVLSPTASKLWNLMR